jgi:hypothetical protein
MLSHLIPSASAGSNIVIWRKVAMEVLTSARRYALNVSIRSGTGWPVSPMPTLDYHRVHAGIIMVHKHSRNRPFTLGRKRSVWSYEPVVQVHACVRPNNNCCCHGEVVAGHQSMCSKHVTRLKRLRSDTEISLNLDRRYPRPLVLTVSRLPQRMVHSSSPSNIKLAVNIRKLPGRTHDISTPGFCRRSTSSVLALLPLQLTKLRYPGNDIRSRNYNTCITSRAHDTDAILAFSGNPVNHYLLYHPECAYSHSYGVVVEVGSHIRPQKMSRF